MPNLYILAEKPAAYRNMVTAFGGSRGEFEGQTFQLGHSLGHLLGLSAPEKMVGSDKVKQQRYKSWQLDTMPWDLDDLDWKKKILTGRNQRNLLKTIKDQSSKCDAFVVATDNDPSGEGDLLGFEIIEKIGWKKPIYRIRFGDESTKTLRKALHNRELVTNYQDYPLYISGQGRERWDFLSIQMTRIATSLAQQQISCGVVNEGRLKSVIINKIYHQQQLVDAYKKVPYYEVKYKDSYGHVFKRDFNEDNVFRLSTQTLGNQDLANFDDDTIDNVTRQKKYQAPGSLLDLMGLASRLSSKYTEDEVINTYQKLYEADYVSYPRTDDTKITDEQYFELLPLANKIADLVGIDKSLLTHRTLRKKHRVAKADHGANRPGTKVPNSLSELKSFGKSAVDIYQTLAKNYLAILGEDYEYGQTKASLKKHPEFKTEFNTPINLNYRRIFVDDDDNEDQLDGKSVKFEGQVATPFLDEGFNPKPTQPSLTWLKNYLKRVNVGTGATRLNTLKALTSGKNKKLNNRKGKYTLTDAGIICAVIADDTWIADPQITKQLFDAMKKVGERELSIRQLLNSAIKLIKHDTPIMQKNAQKLDKLNLKVKTKGTGNMASFMTLDTKNGEKRTFADKFGYPFSKEEIDGLVEAYNNGDSKGVPVEFKAKSGKMYKQYCHFEDSPKYEGSLDLKRGDFVNDGSNKNTKMFFYFDTPNGEMHAFKNKGKDADGNWMALTDDEKQGLVDAFTSGDEQGYPVEFMSKPKPNKPSRPYKQYCHFEENTQYKGSLDLKRGDFAD